MRFIRIFFYGKFKKRKIIGTISIFIPHMMKIDSFSNIKNFFWRRFIVFVQYFMHRENPMISTSMNFIICEYILRFTDRIMRPCIAIMASCIEILPVFSKNSSPSFFKEFIKVCTYKDLSIIRNQLKRFISSYIKSPRLNLFRFYSCYSRIVFKHSKCTICGSGIEYNNIIGF